MARSKSPKPARETSPNIIPHLFRYTDEQEAVSFFLQPELPTELQTNLQAVIKKRGGCCLTPDNAENIPVRGIILVDPRTQAGKKYLKGADKNWRVVSYTFIRACIFKGKLLDLDEFDGVEPIFESVPGVTALKIHLHNSLREELSHEELSALRLDISKHGGASKFKEGECDWIITTEEDLESVSRRYDHSPVRVESYEWLLEVIRTRVIPPLELPATPRRIKKSPRNGTATSRNEFTNDEVKSLVKFLAEYFPAQGDARRIRVRYYEQICKNPEDFPWTKRHASGTWQNYYARNHDILDDKIERYVAGHPDLVLSEKELDVKRKSVFGKERKARKNYLAVASSEADSDLDSDWAELSNSPKPKKAKLKPKPKPKPKVAAEVAPKSALTIESSDESGGEASVPIVEPKEIRPAKLMAQKRVQALAQATDDLPNDGSDDDAASGLSESEERDQPRDPPAGQEEDEVDQLVSEHESGETSDLGSVRNAPPPKEEAPSQDSPDIAKRALRARAPKQDQYSKAVRRSARAK